jgi:hypothetical protein
MAFSESLTLGVVVERRKLSNPWQEFGWSTVAVVLDPPVDIEAGRLLEQGEGRARFFAGTLPVELHRHHTASYRDNMMTGRPQVYVVLRKRDGALPYQPFLATIAPDEAQIFLDTGEDLVDTVPMPEPVQAWVDRFIGAHHVEAPVYKRQRKPYDPRKGGMPGQGPRRGG